MNFLRLQLQNNLDLG